MTMIQHGAPPTSTILGKLEYDVGLGLFLLLLDALMTFLVVNRVVDRQEERKRRALSGLVEARVLEALGGLLADGLPVNCRTPSSEVVAVGRVSVALQVDAINLSRFEDESAQHVGPVLEGATAACSRYAPSIDQPLVATIIEPKLAPDLLYLVNLIDATRGLLAEWRHRQTREVAVEATEACTAMFTAAWALRTAIVVRWT